MSYYDLLYTAVNIGSFFYKNIKQLEIKTINLIEKKFKIKCVNMHGSRLYFFYPFPNFSNNNIHYYEILSLTQYICAISIKLFDYKSI